MSEYQYYEFQAIDRKLTAEDMQALRALSSRATITPASFVNQYNYGDFRGSPEALMEQYFDAHVYIANWGTHRLMLRLPRRFFDEKVLKAYGAGRLAQAKQKGEFVVLDWATGEDSRDGDWEHGEGWLASLLPLRGELLGGDRRALYLGWLLAAQDGELGEDDVEPEVPPGLSRLSPALERFAEFLRLDAALIEVAAEGQTAGDGDDGGAALRAWIAALPVTTKDEYLGRLVAGEDPHLRSELLQEFQRSRAGTTAKRRSAPSRRTVAALLAAAAERAEGNARAAAEREAKERAAREAKEAREKKKRLDALAKDEPSAWRKVDALVAKTDHDEAVALLVDLRDLAEREGRLGPFLAKVGALRSQHKSKQALLRRINKAGLRGPAAG